MDRKIATNLMCFYLVCPPLPPPFFSFNVLKGLINNILDIVTPKQQFYDLFNGTYKGIAYNFNTDPFVLIGRSRYTLGSSVDVRILRCLVYFYFILNFFTTNNNHTQECSTVGTFENCPGKESPPCSGHGRCDHIQDISLCIHILTTHVL